MIKGDRIDLVPATLDDRRRVYEWCFQSETTKYHSGPPDYPEVPIATYEEFCATYYEEYFFTGARPRDGRGYIITSGGAPVGFVSYSCFHLKPGLAELDIWMSGEANCGKGYGTAALAALGRHLHKTLGVGQLIIAPSGKNTRAVRSYQKAGFSLTDKPMRDFLRDEYVALYGDGDYGTEETAILVKRF